MNLAGRKSEHNLPEEGSLSEIGGAKSSAHPAQKAQNEAALTEQQSENQIGHIYQTKQKDNRSKNNGPHNGQVSRISNYRLQSKAGDRAYDQNTDLGDILSPPQSKKVKRNSIAQTSKKKDNILVRNESYKLAQMRGNAAGQQRPQLSNILKLQAILPNEEKEGHQLINTAGLDPGAQSLGEIPIESHTFNDDQDHLKGKQDKKMNIFKNAYSRKVINLQPSGFGATTEHLNKMSYQGENSLDLQSYLADAKQVEMRSNHFIIQMAVKQMQPSQSGDQSGNSQNMKSESSPHRQYQKEQQLKSAFKLGNRLGLGGESTMIKQVPQKIIGLGIKSKLSPTSETKELNQSPSLYRLDNSIVMSQNIRERISRLHSPTQNQDLLSMHRKASQVLLHHELAQQTPVKIDQFSVISSALDQALAKNSSKESLQPLRSSFQKRRNTTIAATLIAKRHTRNRIHQTEDLQLGLLQQKYMESVKRQKDNQQRQEEEAKRATEVDLAPPRVSSLRPGKNVVINPGKSQRVADSQLSEAAEVDGTTSPLYTRFQNSITDQSNLREKIIDLIKASGEKPQPQSPNLSRGLGSPVPKSPQSNSSPGEGRNLRAPYPERIHPDRVKVMQKQLIEKQRNSKRIQHMVVDTNLYPKSNQRQRKANQSLQPSSHVIKRANAYSLQTNMLNSRSIESLNAGNLNSPRVQKTKGNNKIDQKSILEYIDKKVVYESQRQQKFNLSINSGPSPKDIKAPDQRFLSPLAMPSGLGTMGFDQRKKSLLKQKQQLQSQPNKGDPATLLQYLNQNLEELDHTILEQNARSQKVQFALQLTTPQNQSPSVVPTPINKSSDKKGEKFWDKGKISKNNIAFLKDQLDKQDTLKGKHMDIQGPNLFEHQLKNVKDQHKYNFNTNPQIQQPLNAQFDGNGRVMASPLSIDHRSSPVPTGSNSREGHRVAGSRNKNPSDLSENLLDVKIVGFRDQRDITSEQRADLDAKAEKLQKVSITRNSPLPRGGTKTTQVSIDVPQRKQSHQRSQKQLSKIVSDKLVIEESLKDHKPYGAKWVNNKDPDFYESELNLSHTAADDPNQIDRRRGSGSFMKLIGKLPSQMDNIAAKQQDMDLYQLQNDGATTMARATLFPNDNSVNDHSREALDDQKYMDDTRMEFSTSLGHRISKVKDDIVQQNYSKPQSPNFFKVQIAKNDPNFRPQYQTNNLQYKHQMDLKKKLVGAPLSPIPINLSRGQSPGPLNIPLHGIIGGSQNQQMMTLSNSKESIASGMAVDYLNGFQREKRQQQAALQQMLTFDSGKQDAIGSPNTSKGLPYKQVIQTQRERHQNIKGGGAQFKQTGSSSNLFANQRRPTYGNPMQAQIQVSQRSSGSNSPAQSNSQMKIHNPMRQVVVSHHRQSSIQQSNEFSRNPSYLQLQAQSQSNNSGYVMLKPPEISPQRIRNEEDYGTKMMDYPDVNNNNDMSSDISPVKMLPKGSLQAGLGINVGSFIQQTHPNDGLDQQDSFAYIGYDGVGSPHLKSPKIEVKEKADGRQVLKIQEQRNTYEKELAKGGIYIKNGQLNQGQMGGRKPVILRHKRLSKNLNQNHYPGQVAKPPQYKLDGQPRELPAGLVQAISEYQSGNAKNQKPIYRGGQPTMQKLTIATNRPNLGLLHINARDNSPMLVRGADLGVLAQRQQAKLAAEQAKNQPGKSDKWTLEISPFQQTHSGDQNNNFHQLSNYQQREAKEMREAENENSVSEDEIFVQNYKQDHKPDTGSPMTAFLPKGNQDFSPPNAYSKSPTNGTPKKKALKPLPTNFDEEQEERILINDDSDDEGEQGPDQSPRKVKLGDSTGLRSKEQKYNFQTEQRIFEQNNEQM